MVKVKEPSEADIVFNRITVAHARSQRLLASLLPPPTESEKAQVEITPDEKPFDSVPELLGLGLAPSSNDDSTLPKKPSSSLDILGQQLLGKKRAAELQKQKSKTGNGSTARLGFVVNSDASGLNRSDDRGHGPADQSSESEGEGRAVAVGLNKTVQGIKASRKRKRKNGPAQTQTSETMMQSDETTNASTVALPDVDIEETNQSANDEDVAAVPISSSLPRAKAKSRSFLDEILAERASKRKKKKKKKKTGGASGFDPVDM